MLPDNLIHVTKVMLSRAPGNLTMLPGNLDRAPKVMLSRAPGQPNRAPSSLNRAPGQPIVLPGNREHFSKESLHTGARARRHYGQPIAGIQPKSHFNRDGES